MEKQMPIIVGAEAGASDQLARLLCTAVPAGLEEFFEEIGETGRRWRVPSLAINGP
jgi:hypothetical protein